MVLIYNLFQYVYVFVKVGLDVFVVCVFFELVDVENVWWMVCCFVYFQLMGEVVFYVVVVECDYGYWIVLYYVDFVGDGCCCF